MKLHNLQESSPFDNVPFASRIEEIQMLERKERGIEYQKTLIQTRLEKMYPGKFKYSFSFDNVKPEQFTDSLGHSLILKYLHFKRIGDKVRARLQDIRVRGSSYCFTGFRDPQLEYTIRKLGGIVATSVTNNTNYLVRGFKDKASGKMLKAQQNGHTKVITRKQLEDFLRP